MALLRYCKIANGLPVSEEERSGSGHQRNDRFDPGADISQVKIPHRSRSPVPPTYANLSVGSTGGIGSETARAHQAARRRGGRVAARGARAAARKDSASRLSLACVKT